MFESSLIALGPRRPAVRRWLSLPVAVAIHLAALASVAFAQYWQVDLVEPIENVIFVTAAPLPQVAREPDPEPPGGSRRASTPPAPAPPAPPAPGPVQPPSVPDVIPPIPTAPEPAVPGNGSLGDTGIYTTGVPGLEGLGGDGHNTGDGSGGDGRGTGKGSGDGSGDIIYRPGNGVSRPEILSRVEPRYTESARRARLQGTVILDAVIDESGRVRDVRVVKALPMGLDRAAVDAVAQWRFRPAVYEGRPVRVLMTLTVNFVVS